MSSTAFIRKYALPPVALAGLALAAAAASTACQTHPAVTPLCPGKGGIVTTKIRTTNVNSVDLLVMVDNSASMADKSTELARRLPELIKALVDPDVDATGRPKTQRVSSLHVGIITSSLGSHGTSVCDPALRGAHANDHGRLLPRTGENGTVGYSVDHVGGAPNGASCPSPVAASALTWAFDPTKGAQYTGAAQARSMETAVSCIVQSAQEDGCGYEASLESIYHFLIDPAPYLTADVVPACTQSPSGDACGSGKITPSGLDQQLLDERKAFLRPDSLVAVLMLTDENDGSILPAGLNWLPLAYEQGKMLRGWKGCEGVPDDFEPQTSADYASLWSDYHCLSCFQKSPDGTTDPNCSVPWSTIALNADVDGRNLRMFQQTRRIGYNFLWGRQRYVDAFASPLVTGSDGKLAANPIYAGGVRSKDLVLVTGLLGVPNGLLPKGADGAAQDLTEADWDKIVSPDLAKRDPHMIEQIAPRTSFGLAKFAGDRTVDPVHGGERAITNGDDLQYACIAPRDPSVQPLPATDPDCSAPGAAASNPLCGPDVGSKGTQPYFKAYPTLRQLRVLHALQQAKVPTHVASLCTDSYASAMQGIIGKLQAALNAQCLKTLLVVEPATGAVSCKIVQVFGTAQPKGAARCEALNGAGKSGYCTPGAAPCRFAVDSKGNQSDYPPVSADAAAKQLSLSLSVIDAATGAARTELVSPAADPDGNVYATGSDGIRHLVCETLELAGNPTIPAAEQTACLKDPTFTLTDGSGGWCYSTDAAVVGTKCIAAGALGTMRYFGSVQDDVPGAEMFTLCTDGTTTPGTCG
jgi:hypothetical protein